MLAREERATSRITDRLLFRRPFTVRAGAAGAAFGLRQEALQSGRFVPPAGAIDGGLAALSSANSRTGNIINPRGTTARGEIGLSQAGDNPSQSRAPRLSAIQWP